MKLTTTPGATKNFRYSLGFAVTLAFVTVAHAAATSDPRLETARKTLMPFKKNLKEALAEAVPKGPEAAVAVCSLKAPEIAAALSKDGVMVGRTTTKPRNPKNAPADWMVPLLAELEKAPKKEGAFLTKTLADGRLAYVEPIYVQAMCLTCHADRAKLTPATVKILDEKYPQDKATGYQEGDFRGMFWVTVK